MPVVTVYLYRSMNALRGSAMAALIANLACGRSQSDRQAEAQPSSVSVSELTPVATSSTSSNAKAADPCPRTGLWAQCSVEKRLSQAGYVVNRLPDSVRRRNGFDVLPIAYQLGRSRLDVFIYPTADAVKREVEHLDTATAGPRGARSQWGIGVQPTFVRSANLIAVYLTDNPTQSERLTLALTAGPPQR